MTCGSCLRTVQRLLSEVPGVRQVNIELAREEAVIEMSEHIPTEKFKDALRGHPRYSIQDQEAPAKEEAATTETVSQSWLQTYKPVLLIFVFITAVSAAATVRNGRFDPMLWMRYFMAGFFLAFSFFKFLDLRGFSDSYATYDIIARRWKSWGYVYAFLEFLLGMAFLTGFFPVFTNAFTFVLMSVSLAGVLQSLLKKRAIRCACLGTVFNLPMSTITVTEDSLMILMSAGMLIAVPGF